MAPEWSRTACKWAGFGRRPRDPRQPDIAGGAQTQRCDGDLSDMQ